MAKVLVIEDDPAMLRMTSRILVGAGHQVVEASDGRAGVRIFREEAPDLVVTDIVMPEQEGLETMRKILELAPGAKIIAVSGGGSDGGELYLTLASQLGASAMLQKPFRPEELKAAVDKVLAGG